MNDNFVVLETSFSSQNVARFRAKLQREKTTHRVEIDVAIEINKLRVEIKRLQTKRDISIVQQHVMKKKSFEKRRFFLHHDNESQFMPLAKMFPIVNRKHFAKIFKCIFMSKQLHKLVNDYLIKNVLRIEIENDLFDFDIKDMSHLTRCFEIYCQIVLELTLESMYKKLNKVFCLYRCHLNTFLINYTFEFVLVFHKTFMYARISEIQDDSKRWMIIDKRMKNNHLVRRNNVDDNKLKKLKFDKLERDVSYDLCKRFNNDIDCSRCFWKHQCVICQSSNHDMKRCTQISNVSISTINKISIEQSRRHWLVSIISISLLSINESFSYELTSKNASFLKNSKSLHIDAWKAYLQKHLDRQFVKTLVRLITCDAKIEYIELNQLLLSSNHFFVFNALDIFTNDFHKQMKTHRITKVKETLFAHFVSFSLRLISKTNESWKRIHNLSYLKANAKRIVISINVYILEEWNILEYVIFDEIVQILIQQDRDAILMKRDLVETFRHMSMTMIDWWLLNFFWKDNYYFDRFLLFDLRISLYIFDFLTKALHWMLLIIFHWVIILHYLNDFFVILSSSIDAILYQSQFDDLCVELKLKVNHKKNICDTTIDFLNIELDNELIKARLLSKKLERVVHEIKFALEQSFLSHIELQSLMNFLSFVVKMIISNKTFFRRLYDALRTKVSRHRIISIMKFDLQWWDRFLLNWNDIKFLSKHRLVMHMWIDAFENYDIEKHIFESFIDAFMLDLMFNHRFSTRLCHKHINVKEMTSISFVIKKWLNFIVEKHLVIHDDNFVVVFDFKKRSIQKTIMISLREICMLLAKHDVTIIFEWIFIKKNILVDFLSRDKWTTIINTWSQLLKILSIDDTIKQNWVARLHCFFDENSLSKHEMTTCYVQVYTRSIHLHWL